MATSHPMQKRRRRRIALLLLALLLPISGILLFTQMFGSSARMRQKAEEDRVHFTQAVQQAQKLGMPDSLLQPLLAQQQQLSSSSAPFSLFNPGGADEYYRALALNYQKLAAQVPVLLNSATQQQKTQAQNDLHTLDTTLHQHSARDSGAAFSSVTSQSADAQKLFEQAHTLADYTFVSRKATTATRTLTELQTVSQQLATLKEQLLFVQQNKLDQSLLNTSYQQDVDETMHVKSLQDVEHLRHAVEIQQQQAGVAIQQALPYLIDNKIDQLNQQVGLLHRYGADAQVLAQYQDKLNADQVLGAERKKQSPSMTVADYQAFSNHIDAEIGVLQNDNLRYQARYLLQQFSQEAHDWGNAHRYADSYDGQNYPLNAGYLEQGIGSDLSDAFNNASTPEEYQNVVDTVNNALFNLHLLESDTRDTTPYDQVHTTDMQALDHYALQKGQVIVVSLSEQALRLYQDGKLVRAFQVTTGRPERPSLPGVWPAMERLSPTTFHSSDPPGSPYWYPPTPIHYAILYHDGGYFIHDSWWRADYGPGTQFPHADSSGNETYSGNGSHGCINMQEEQAGWLYNNTSGNTPIVIY